MGKLSHIKKVLDFIKDERLKDVQDVPVIFDEAAKMTHYDGAADRIVIRSQPTDNAATRKVVAHEAYHALENRQGINPETYALEWGSLVETPEFKSAYEDLGDLMIQAGVSVDDMPSPDTFRMADDAYELVDDMVYNIGRVTNDNDILLKAEEAGWRLSQALDGSYKTPDQVIHEKPAEVRADEFSKSVGGKNDLLGQADPKILPALAAGGAGAAFVQKRAEQGSSIAKQALETAGLLGSSVVAGLAGNLSRLGGAINPFITPEESEAGAQALMNNLTYMPSEPNAAMEWLGEQMGVFSQDIQRGVDALNADESIPVQIYENLPRRGQMAAQSLIELL